jgi:hypothetical protein
MCFSGSRASSVIWSSCSAADIFLKFPLAFSLAGPGPGLLGPFGSLDSSSEGVSDVLDWIDAWEEDACK